MITDFRNELAVIRQQERLAEAAEARLAATARASASGRIHASAGHPGPRLGRLLRRLAGPVGA